MAPIPHRPGTEPRPAAAEPKRFYGLYVAAVSVSLYFFTNGMALFVPQNLFPRFMREFHATEAAVSRTVALTLLGSAIMAPLVGHIIDRFGVVRTIRAGLVIMGVTVSLYPFAQSLTHLYLLHIGLALGLILAGLIVNVVLLSQWFVAKRGRAVGLLVASSSLAGLALPNLISPLVTNPQLGWRWGYGLLAVLFWLIPFTLGFTVLKESPAVVGQFPDGAPQPPVQSPEDRIGLSFKEALRTPTLWFLTVGAACLSFAIQSMNSQATIFFEREAGLAIRQATSLYSLLFGFSMAGKFFFGYLGDVIEKRRVMLITSLILLAGCLLLFQPAPAADQWLQLTRRTPQLALFAAVFGIGFGGTFTMIHLVTVETFGHRAIGKILGMVILGDSLASTAGTLVISQLKTSTGSYFAPFAVVTLVVAIAVPNVLMIKPLTAHPAMRR